MVAFSSLAYLGRKLVRYEVQPYWMCKKLGYIDDIFAGDDADLSSSVDISQRRISRKIREQLIKVVARQMTAIQRSKLS